MTRSGSIPGRSAAEHLSSASPDGPHAKAGLRDWDISDRYGAAHEHRGQGTCGRRLDPSRGGLWVSGRVLLPGGWRDRMSTP
jgi:hypothetical protein